MRRSLILFFLVAVGCSENGENKRCTPGHEACLGNEVHRCNNEGTAFELARVCGPGEICKSGTCVVDTCGNGACDADESCISCAADCGACPPPGDGGLDGSPTCPPHPDNTFCYNDKIMKCDSTGSQAKVVLDCSTLSCPGVTFSCDDCIDWARCDNDKNVWASGTATGPIPFTFSARAPDHNGCNYDADADCHTYFEDGVFRHSGQTLTGGIETHFSLKIPGAVSGKTLPLYPSSALQPIRLRIWDDNMPLSAGWDNTSIEANKGPPPDVGQVSLTFSGSQKCASWSLDISGYLQYREQSSETLDWKEFTYKASGILSYKPGTKP